MTGVESGSEVPASPSSVDTQYSEASEIKYDIHFFYVILCHAMICHVVALAPLSVSILLLPHDLLFSIFLFYSLEVFRFFCDFSF